MSDNDDPLVFLAQSILDLDGMTHDEINRLRSDIAELQEQVLAIEQKLTSGGPETGG